MRLQFPDVSWTGEEKKSDVFLLKHELGSNKGTSYRSSDRFFKEREAGNIFLCQDVIGVFKGPEVPSHFEDFFAKKK